MFFWHMFLSPGESLDGDHATCMFIFLICYLLQAKEWEPWISNSYRTKLETSCCLHLSFGSYSNTYVPIVSFIIFSLICQREIYCNFAADKVHLSMPSILINCNSIQFYVSGWRMYWPESIFVICMHKDGAKRFILVQVLSPAITLTTSHCSPRLCHVMTFLLSFWQILRVTKNL